MQPSLDTLSTFVAELGPDELDVTGAYFPVPPIPWMCFLYPQICGLRV